MGVRTDAILYYGYEMSSESYGGMPDWLQRPEKIKADEWDEDMMGTLSFYIQENGSKEVEVDSHCHVEDPYYYMCITALRYRAWRGQATTIPNELPQPSEKALKELEAAADLIQMPEEQKQTRGWHLVVETDF